MESLVQGEKKSLANGYVFGAPVKDFGFFGTLLISLATALMGFMLATFIGIFGLVLYNHNGHAVDLSRSYKWGGISAGLLVFLVVAAYLGTFWARRVLRKA